MAFKLNNPPYEVDNTPIYQVHDMDKDTMGIANMNGGVTVDKDLPPHIQEDVIRHEKVHVLQMKRGDLAYDDDCVWWKGKCHPRSTMNEGAKNLPWEKEAYEDGNMFKYA